MTLIAQLCTVDKQRHTDGDTPKNRNSGLAVVLFLFQLFKTFLFLFRQRLLVLAAFLGFLFKVFKFLVLLIGQPLVVDVHLIGLWHCLGLADNLFQVIKLLQFQVIELHQLVIIQALVLETVADNPFHINTFELLQHLGYIELAHLRAFDGDNRTEVQELAHNLAVVPAGFSCLGRNLCCLGNDFQCPVRRKVKHITLFLDASVDGGWRLHTEDGLHIT